MNAKLYAIADLAAQDIRKQIEEAETELLKAWQQSIEESEAQDKPAKFRLGFVITLDAGSDKMQTDLTFGIRRKLTIERAMPDPEQATLPLEKN